LRILIVLALVKILELSRFNLTNTQVSRSFYDLLSFALLTAFFLYIFLFRYTENYEQKIEKIIQQTAKKWIVLLDIVVLGLMVVFVYKTVGILYAHPVRCMTADMLPMIRGSGELLLSGESPFHKIFCPWDIGYVYPPMMMIYYLPAVLARIDIRFLSLLCLVGLLLFSYYYYRKKGFILTGFLITLIVITSGLFPFMMLSIHTFPYLLVLALLFYSLTERKWKTLFFSFALAIASQKFFWFYIPFIIIYLIKQRKINLPNLSFFGLGTLIGCFPLLLFPHPVLLTYFEHLKYQSQYMLKQVGTYQIVHSLGFSHYLFDHNLLVSTISVIFFIVLFFLAIKFIKRSNLWIFLSFVTFFMTYFQNHTRAQEYYFLPLLVIIIFSPMKSLEPGISGRRFLEMSILILVFAVFISIGYPSISGKELIINPIRGYQNMHITSAGHLSSKGYIEISLGGNFGYKDNKGLKILIRRSNYKEDKPVEVKILVNEKPCFSGIFHSRKIHIVLDETSLKKHFYVGANDMEIELIEPEVFSVELDVIDIPSQ
jgi:hypothetical protein